MGNRKVLEAGELMGLPACLQKLGFESLRLAGFGRLSFAKHC